MDVSYTSKINTLKLAIRDKDMRKSKQFKRKNKKPYLTCVHSKKRYCQGFIKTKTIKELNEQK